MKGIKLADHQTSIPLPNQVCLSTAQEICLSDPSLIIYLFTSLNPGESTYHLLPPAGTWVF